MHGVCTSNRMFIEYHELHVWRMPSYISSDEVGAAHRCWCYLRCDVDLSWEDGRMYDSWRVVTCIVCVCVCVCK